MHRNCITVELEGGDCPARAKTNFLNGAARATRLLGGNFASTDTLLKTWGRSTPWVEGGDPTGHSLQAECITPICPFKGRAPNAGFADLSREKVTSGSTKRSWTWRNSATYPTQETTTCFVKNCVYKIVCVPQADKSVRQRGPYTREWGNTLWLAVALLFANTSWVVEKHRRRTKSTRAS